MPRVVSAAVGLGLALSLSGCEEIEDFVNAYVDQGTMAGYLTCIEPVR